jgi:hypothetical protein
MPTRQLMPPIVPRHSRRRFIRAVVGLGASLSAPLSLLAARALAMGFANIPQGIHRLEGRVHVNGRPARVGDRVAVGDEVATGSASQVVFVIERSVYLLRADTRLVVAPTESAAMKSAASRALKLLHGKMLACFGGGRHQVITPTAVAAIRGSAAYVEAADDHTYVCLCYGIAELQSRLAPEVTEVVRTTHHESPRMIYPPSSSPRVIVPAPVFNHTDAELIALERIAWRTPPFVDEEGVNHY